MRKGDLDLERWRYWVIGELGLWSLVWEARRLELRLDVVVEEGCCGKTRKSGLVSDGRAEVGGMEEEV